jgi:hypothetical protein
MRPNMQTGGGVVETSLALFMRHVISHNPVDAPDFWEKDDVIVQTNRTCK